MRPRGKQSSCGALRATIAAAIEFAAPHTEALLLPDTYAPVSPAGSPAPLPSDSAAHPRSRTSPTLGHSAVFTLTRSHFRSSRTTCDQEMPFVHQERLVNPGQGLSKHRLPVAFVARSPDGLRHNNLPCKKSHPPQAPGLLRQNPQNHGPGICTVPSQHGWFSRTKNLGATALSREKAEERDGGSKNDPKAGVGVHTPDPSTPCSEHHEGGSGWPWRGLGRAAGPGRDTGVE